MVAGFMVADLWMIPAAFAAMILSAIIIARVFDNDCFRPPLLPTVCSTCSFDHPADTKHFCGACGRQIDELCYEDNLSLTGDAYCWRCAPEWHMVRRLREGGS